MEHVQHTNIETTDTNKKNRAHALAPPKKNPPIALPKHGPPYRCTPELRERIIAYFSESPKTVGEIAAEIGHSISSIYRWMAREPIIWDAYCRARPKRAMMRLEDRNVKLDEIERRAEDATHDRDYLKKLDLQARIQHIRAGYDQWMAERDNPAMYSSRQRIDVHDARDPMEVRDEAWRMRQEAQDVDYSDVDST